MPPTPNSPGLYVLLLRLPEPRDIAVGRLGAFDFPAGWYTYVGSACGPGGLAGRIAHHGRREKLLHWHVDYLRAYARLIEVWFATGRSGNECAWASALAALPGATVPVPRFGSSDCHCRAHLVHFGARPEARAFSDQAGVRVFLEVMTGAAMAEPG